MSSHNPTHPHARDTDTGARWLRGATPATTREANPAPRDVPTMKRHP